MHRTLRPTLPVALLFTLLGTACAGDDDDDDGATAPTTADDASAGDSSSGDDDPTTSSGSPTSATSSPTDDDATASDSSDDDGESSGAQTGDDASTTGAPECGPAPEICEAVTAREIECDPSLASDQDEILAQCTCYAAGLSQSDACVAAFEAYYECVLAVPCEELSEPPCDDADVLACEL